MPPGPWASPFGVAVAPDENATHRRGVSNGTATGPVCVSRATASVKACQPRVV